MTQDHIVKSFDNELAALDNMIAEMGGLVEAHLADAIDALIKRDPDRAAKVIEADAEVDALEVKLNNFAIRTLALRQPMADDLRVVISALKTAAILERTGDYTKNIAKRTVPLSQSSPMGSTTTIARMAQLVQGMIKNVLDAYVARDEVKAKDVRDRDDEVDALHTSMFRELLTYMAEDPRNITPCTHLLFVAKNLERVGDHATNIAEQVMFLVEGQNIDTGRPKHDQSSYTVVEPVVKSGKGTETQ